MSWLFVSVASTAARNARLLLVVIAVAWLATLCLIASLTPHAFVFSDEAGYFLPMLFGHDENNYRQWSILPTYPSYLYFQIYSLLSSDDPHTSAKMLNACFIAGTAIPTYAVSRRYLATPLAAALAAVVMLSPISSFVRYVMPEPVYFFGFWLIILVVLSTLEKSPLFSAITGGALIGVLSLVKPHALALTLGLGLFFLLRACRCGYGTAAIVQFFAYYTVHVALAFLLTGKWLWSVTGATYGSMLSSHDIDLLAAAHNLAGHVGAIATLIAIPLTVTVVFVIRQRRFASMNETENPVIQRLWDLGLLACCLLTVMVAMTVYFSQSVYQINPEGERITRLHGRYYFYAIPLFALVLLGLWRAGVDLRQLVSARAFVIGCVVMIAAAASIGMIFELGAVDFPDMAIFSGLRGLLVTIGLFGVILALHYYCGGITPTHTRLFVATVIWWAAASLLTSAALLFIGPLRGAFQAGPVDAEFFGATDQLGLHKLVGRADGVIVGSSNSAADVFRMMFYLRSLSAGKITPPGTEFKDNDFPNGARWAVFLPDVRYVGSAQVVSHGPVSVVWSNSSDSFLVR